jgi:hypothetical protein
MERIAERARASKASLYRRWPTRIELVMDAVYHTHPDPISTPDTGSLRGDLLAALRQAASLLTGPTGEALRGLLTTSRAIPPARLRCAAPHGEPGAGPCRRSPAGHRSSMVAMRYGVSLDQKINNICAGPGDSGGPVYDDPLNGNRAHGIMVASNIHINEDGSYRCEDPHRTSYTGIYNAEQAMEVRVRTW